MTPAGATTSLASRPATPERRRVLLRTIAVTAAALGSAFGAPLSHTRAETTDPSAQTPLGAKADAGRGQVLFDQYCARCHGAGGSADARHGVPVLAGQRFGYLVQQLSALSDGARDGASMHRALSTAELTGIQARTDVAAYLAGARVPANPQRGDGSHLPLGEATFRVLCVSCHHEDAGGDDDGPVPSLRNQHYAYLLSQMRRIPGLHRHGIDENFAALLRSLDRDEAAGIADYLSRQRGPTPRR